jgi:hypothetical protein
VTGLGYFHGAVPYNSSLTFGGTLGSSTLNNFTRQSVGGYNPAPNLGQTQTFYAPSQLVSTDSGRISPGMAAAQSPAGFSISMTGAGTISPNSAAGARSASRTQVSLTPTDQAVDYSKIGNQQIVPGVDTQQTDPLFGLKRTLELPPIPATVTTTDNENPQAGNQSITPGARVSPNGNNPNNGETFDPNNPDALKDPNNPNANGKSGPQDRGALDRVDDRRLGDRVASGRINTAVAQGRVVDSMEITVPTYESNALRVSDTYQGVLNNLRLSTGPGLRFAPAGLTPEGAIPDSTRFALPTGPQLEPPSIDPMTGKLRQSPRPGSPEDVQSVDPTKANYRLKGAVAGPPEGTGIARNIAMTGGAASGGGRNTGAGAATQPSDLTASVVGRPPVPASTLLTQADRELADGQYLHAADTYQSVLRQHPGDTRALQGRAISELGGGMYESAVYDLKFLFTEDPNQITTHYPVQNVLDSKRLDFLEKDLLGLLAKKDQTPAAFLLSYLYYQAGREDELRTTMDSWAQRWPTDAWPKVLRKCWLEPPKPAETVPSAK